MKKIAVAILLLVALLTSCSGLQGQMGKRVDEFTDGFVRSCTVVKWGDSASIDCDWK